MNVASQNLDDIERELKVLADEFSLHWISYREVSDKLEGIARRVAVESERVKDWK